LDVKDADFLLGLESSPPVLKPRSFGKTPLGFPLGGFYILDSTLEKMKFKFICMKVGKTRVFFKKQPTQNLVATTPFKW